MKKGTILICDDDPAIRDALKLILSDDYNLVFASNGEEAVQRVKQFGPELAIFDIKMPRVNGLEAVRRVKRVRRRMKILIITGYESSDVAALAIKRGANDYLLKPFERHKVVQQVKALLGETASPT